MCIAEPVQLRRLTAACDTTYKPVLEPVLEPHLWYIHGRPYDLKGWLDEHPGGAEIIKACKGTDCTVLFETYHAASLRSEWISSLLERYSVVGHGCLEPNPQWSKTPVYDDLKQVVQAYRMKQGGIKASRWSLFSYVVWGLAHYASLSLWLRGYGGWSVPVALGVTMWFFCGDLLHHGTHYSLCKSATLSRRIGMCCGWMFCLPHTWTRQHVTGHHVHTNEHEADPDLYHWDRLFDVAPWASSLLPQTIRIRWIWYMAPIFTQVVPPVVCTLDILRLGRWPGVGEKIPFYAGEWFQMAMVWSLYMMGHALIAYTYGVLWALLPSIVTGCLYYAFSQVSHLNQASFKAPLTAEWVVREIGAAQGDYQYGSLLWNKLSLGLNNQTMHHMFPSVHPCHFPALNKDIYKVFKKHGLPVQCWNKTYIQSLRDHCNWLRFLNPSNADEGNSVQKL